MRSAIESILDENEVHHHDKAYVMNEYDELLEALKDIYEANPEWEEELPIWYAKAKEAIRKGNQ